MCDEQEIDEYLIMLESMINGVPGAIVDDVDEVGFESRVDANRKYSAMQKDRWRCRFLRLKLGRWEGR
jgi:hypothetical protein